MSKKKKLSRKAKKKASKKMLKEVCSSKLILDKFRVIFGMYDYGTDEVRHALKTCVKRFIKSRYMKYADAEPGVGEFIEEHEASNKHSKSSKDSLEALFNG